MFQRSVFLSFAIFALGVMVSCGPSSKSPPTGQKGTPSLQPTANTPIPTPTVSVAVSPTSKPVATPPPPPPFDESLLNGREFLLQIRKPEKTIAAQDFSIGVLEDGEDNPRSHAAFLVARDFFEKLSKKIIDPTNFSSRWSDFLTRNLQGMIDTKIPWTQWRLGKLSAPDEGGLFAQFLVKNDKKNVLGFIYLVEEKGTWKVSDIQIDWKELLGTDQQPSGLFDPEGLRRKVPF